MKHSIDDERRPWACVIGDISLIRALGIRKIPVALATPEEHVKGRLSRYCRAVIETPRWVDDPEGVADALEAWADRQELRPVLFYQGDSDLLFVSRYRDRLARFFRLVLPRAELVEDLVDKSRFCDLSERMSLPVPETLAIPGGAGADEVAGWNRFPCVLKPVTRWPKWHEITGGAGKALRIERREDLLGALRGLEDDGLRFLLQASVEGGEENVVSYHAYVRPSGEAVTEFTGRKVRTYPRQYGLSTYLEITDDPEVRDLGREIVAKLDFTGVLKIDFKRDVRDGRLYMLEINPRFNLWHHPGTVAGAAIPEAVYWDCVDPSRVQPTASAREGVRWVVPLSDSRALKEYRAAGALTFLRWLRQILAAEVNEGFQLSDPLPAIADVAELFKKRLTKAPTG